MSILTARSSRNTNASHALRLQQRGVCLQSAAAAAGCKRRSDRVQVHITGGMDEDNEYWKVVQ
jgi:hypothetical protein